MGALFRNLKGLRLCLVLSVLLVLLLPPGVPLAEESEGVQYDGYIFDPSGKRDPFRSLILGRKEDEKRRKEAERLRFVKRKAAFDKAAATIPFTPLQGFDLESLKLTMVLLGDKGKFALIEVP
ncbi:MAG: hypothetical protein ACE5FU_05775, partial [Nitrospinota bacterium]